MRWSENLEAFLKQARSSNLTAGPDFDSALASVPDEHVQDVAAGLEAELGQERDLHGFTPRKLGPGQPTESQVLSAEDVQLWDAANKKLKAARLWRDGRLGDG